MVHAFMSGNYGVSHFLHLRLVSQGVMSIYVYYGALESRGECGFFQPRGRAAFPPLKLTKVRERVFPLYYGINNQHKHGG
jgi:hypothetical protein